MKLTEAGLKKWLDAARRTEIALARLGVSTQRPKYKEEYDPAMERKAKAKQERNDGDE